MEDGTSINSVSRKYIFEANPNIGGRVKPTIFPEDFNSLSQQDAEKLNCQLFLELASLLVKESSTNLRIEEA